MKFLILFSSLLVQIALCKPPPFPSPYFKAIFNHGEVITEQDTIKVVGVEYVNDLLVIRFTHQPSAARPYDYMAITKGDKEWSDLEFVIEKKDHKCDETSDDLKPLIHKCDGKMELRALNDKEKAKAAGTSTVLAAIANDKLKFKVTHNKCKQIAEFGPDLKQMKIENHKDHKSVTIQAVVDPTSQGYMTLQGPDMFIKEKFVVESNPDSDADCKATPLERLLCLCSGHVKLRELTADEASSFGFV